LTNIIPRSFYALGVAGAVVGVIGIGVALIGIIVGMVGMEGYIGSGLVGSVRGSVAMQIGVISQQLAYGGWGIVENGTCGLDDNAGWGITDDRVPLIIDEEDTFSFSYGTNPVWLNSSHLSEDFIVVRDLLQRDLQYFVSLTDVVQYGTLHSGFNGTGDEMIDGLSIKRTKGRFKDVEQLETSQTSCILEDEELCIDGRLSGIIGEYKGLDNLINIFDSAVIRMSSEVARENINAQNVDFEMIYTLLLWDLRDGLDILYRMTSDDGISSVNSQVTLVVLLSVLGAFTLIIGAGILLMPLAHSIGHVERVTMMIEQLTVQPTKRRNDQMTKKRLERRKKKEMEKEKKEL
ncbi:MAG: hypothetical protein EZS28_050583, partial [Streblomastix strix]